MRKTLATCLLVLLLTGSVVAGVMPNGTIAPTDQQTSSVQAPTDATQGTTTDGEMTNDTAASMTQTALDLLAALPSLL
jgi:hypothetical protein